MSDITGNNDDESTLPLSAEMMDRDERKAHKDKLRAEKAAKKETLADTQIEETLADSSLARAQKAKQKNLKRLGFVFIGLLLFWWLWNFLFSPYQGDMRFGICKTFLELNVRFPQELEYSTIEEFKDRGIVRIWYTQLDAFGEHRAESLQCHYKEDTEGISGGYGEVLDKILVNRRLLEKSRVDAFNPIIVSIVNSPVDLTMPYNLPESLKDLQFDTDKFRFQLNIRSKF